MIKTSTIAVTPEGEPLKPMARVEKEQTPVSPPPQEGDWERLVAATKKGMEGNTPNLPIGFPRLNNHISIRPRMYYLIGGYTGSGKTSFLDDAFVLNPIDYLALHPESLIKLKVNYFSMERSKDFKYSKWITRRIFLDHGIIIPIDRFFGWRGPKNAMTKDEHDLFLMYKDYLEHLKTIVNVMDGPQNPMGVKKYVDEYALKHGRIERISQYQSVYVANDPNLITLNIYDHIGKWRRERRGKDAYTTKKQLIDLASDETSHRRDFYGHTEVAVSQFNRDIANPMRIKNGDVEPQLEDFKESGNTQEDADAVLTLFDVMRYPQIDDPSGYNLDRLRDMETGAKKYRSLKIAKNTYGSDDIRIGLAFQPVIGHFKEMPKIDRLVESDYDKILDDSYFKL